MDHRSSRVRSVDLPDGFVEGAAQAVDDVGEGLLRQAVRRAQLLRCALRGLTAKDAAAFVGCSHATACGVYNDPGFRRMVLEKQAGVFEGVDERFEKKQLSLHERIERKAVDAFEKLCDLLDSPETNPSLQFRVAQDILDRTPEVAKAAPRAAEDLESVLRIAASAASDMDAKVVEMKRRA